MSAQTTEPAVSAATEDLPNGVLGQAGELDLAQGEDAAAEPSVSLRPSAAPAEDGAVWPRGPVPGGLQALWTGARRVLGRPRLLLAMWLMSLTFGLLASFPVKNGLSGLLDMRPAATLIARGQADVLLIELLSDNRSLISMAVAAALATTLLYFLMQLGLSGGLLATLRHPRHPQRVTGSQILATAAQTAGAMFKLELVFALVARLPLLLVTGGALMLLNREKTLNLLSLEQIVLRNLPVIGLFAVLWAMLSVTLNHARLTRISALHQSTALRLTWASLKFAFSRSALGSVAVLGLLSVGLWLLLVVVGRVIAARLDYRLAVAAAFGVRQLFALLRVWLGLSLVAAAAELHDGVTSDAAVKSPAQTH